MTTTRANSAETDLTAECARLRRENETLAAERRVLELQVRGFKLQLWGRKSERHAPLAGQQAELFRDPAPEPSPVARPVLPRAASASARRTPKGPKPLDPNLRREVIAVPDCVPPPSEHLPTNREPSSRSNASSTSVSPVGKPPSKAESHEANTVTGSQSAPYSARR